jgi:hypothetical protein
MSQGPQPYDPIKNPQPERGDDPVYVTQMVHAAFAARATLPKDDLAENEAAGFTGVPNIDYWVYTAILGRGYTWGPYWWDNKIVNADLDERGGRKAGGGGGGGGDVGSGATGGGAGGALVNRQLGLLEDDIVYRLSLLAVNVLQPLKDQYPNIVVIGGFRQVNTGIGQHELGEAVDLQIRNQTPTQLFEVADYINKHLNFDQLVLNWTDIGDQQGWIHVSFSVDSLRGQVHTKDFADAFHEGLFLCEPLTGEAAAAALRDQAASDASILKDLQATQDRQNRLGVGVAVTTSGDSGGDAAPIPIPSVGGPDGVSFDHDWNGKVENALRAILATGLAGPDGGNGQAVIDQMNAMGPLYSGAEFQPRHDGGGYRTYGFGWFYVSYALMPDGTGQYQIVEFGVSPAGN